MVPLITTTLLDGACLLMRGFGRGDYFLTRQYNSLTNIWTLDGCLLLGTQLSQPVDDNGSDLKTITTETIISRNFVFTFLCSTNNQFIELWHLWKSCSAMAPIKLDTVIKF